MMELWKELWKEPTILKWREGREMLEDTYDNTPNKRYIFCQLTVVGLDDGALDGAGYLKGGGESMMFRIHI